MGFAEDVHAAGAYVRDADGVALDGALAGFIGRFVSPSFSVSRAAIEDSEGMRTEQFSAVVHTGQVQHGIVRG